MRITAHLDSPTATVSLVHGNEQRGPIGYAEIHDGRDTIAIASPDPDHLLDIADAFVEASRRLRAAKVALVEQVTA